MKLVLIGCAKTKRGPHHLQAQDLYRSPLFAKRRAYAERSGETWAILSALHGIVPPERVLAPYDVTLRTGAQAQMLAGAIATQLHGDWRDVDVIEVHAGSLYVEAVLRATMKLHSVGRNIGVEAPLAGLPIGKQLAWYGRGE